MTDSPQVNSLVDDLESAIDPQVLHRLPDIGRLVSLPKTTYTLLSLLVDENTLPSDLEKVLEQDPALAAKVISLSNSAFYSLESPVSSLHRAILVIGFKELEFMAMGLGLSETFDLSQVPAGFDGEGLWLHSLAVSWIARELAAITGVAEASEAMITGLLHELGLIILVSKFPLQFQQLLELVSAGMSFFEAEAALGLKHGAIGFLLARNWNLPEIFQEGILYHHNPEEAPRHQKVAALVALADNLAHKAGFPMKMETLDLDLSFILPTLSLPVEKLQNFIKDLMVTMPRIQPIWIQMMKSAPKPDRGVKARFQSLLGAGKFKASGHP
ncbi:MAG: HDOD domain-containing protein [Deltaproteobacteria bacterium]|nr:HDOD domain-containing protein [Deltaproteobacteria bacterium]